MESWLKILVALELIVPAIKLYLVVDAMSLPDEDDR
jgi:hypothetical protein